MRDIWDAIQTIQTWDQFTAWYAVQSLGMQVFLGLIIFGIVFTAFKLVYALVPWE